MRRYLIPILLFLAGLALALKLVPAEQAAVAARLQNFPDADHAAHQLRPVVMTILCFIPAIGGIFYASGSILARYVARQFITLLAIGFSALATLWLLMDFQNNLDDLKGTQSVVGTGF